MHTSPIHSSYQHYHHHRYLRGSIALGWPAHQNQCLTAARPEGAQLQNERGSTPLSLQPRSGGSLCPSQAWLTLTSFLMTQVQPRAGPMGPRRDPVAWATLQPRPRPRQPSCLILCPTWPWPTGAAWRHRAKSWWTRM